MGLWHHVVLDDVVLYRAVWHHAVWYGMMGWWDGGVSVWDGGMVGWWGIAAICLQCSGVCDRLCQYHYTVWYHFYAGATLYVSMSVFLFAC